MILGSDGKPLGYVDSTGAAPSSEACDHGVTFDCEAALKLVEDWQPQSAFDFVRGPPGTAEIRKRWPRLDGPCPKGCGYVGIAYASYEHYLAGDW